MITIFPKEQYRVAQHCTAFFKMGNCFVQEVSTYVRVACVCVRVVCVCVCVRACVLPGLLNYSHEMKSE